MELLGKQVEAGLCVLSPLGSGRPLGGFPHGGNENLLPKTHIREERSRADRVPRGGAPKSDLRTLHLGPPITAQKTSGMLQIRFRGRPTPFSHQSLKSTKTSKFYKKQCFQLKSSNFIVFSRIFQFSLKTHRKFRSNRRLPRQAENRLEIAQKEPKKNRGEPGKKRGEAGRTGEEAGRSGEKRGEAGRSGELRPKLPMIGPLAVGPKFLQFFQKSAKHRKITKNANSYETDQNFQETEILSKNTKIIEIPLKS